MSPADADRLADARNGSADALGELLETCRAYLLGVANREIASIVAGKIGASDVVQETFLEAQRGFAGFRGRTTDDLLAWLRGILLHRLASHHRSFLGTEKRDARREITAGDTPLETAATGRTPSSILSWEEESARVNAALDRLPEQYRRVLVWRQWDDLPFDEIARRLGKSTDAARMIWWRAAERLQQELGTDHAPPRR